MNELKDGNSIVKHPNHYNIYDVEVIDMMAAICSSVLPIPILSMQFEHEARSLGV